MCGFVSIINTNLESQRLSSIIDSLKKINQHRGPDEIRGLHKKNYSILFRRLEIIDLTKKASQPLQSEDLKISLVFNGEIYNYLELKEELESKKIKFRTKSDTEVILKSYQFWGTDFITKIRGMFSIIIFDDLKNKIFCFRDRLGQKPLYYSKFSGGVILSSEIKDIIFIKKKENIKENSKTVLKYLLRGWCDDNENTFFKDIFSFPPGSVGQISESSIKIKKYWTLDISQNKKFNPEEFNDIFYSNIKIHLRSDVPLAFTLSGGLDSSSIVKTSLNFISKKYNSFSVSSNFEEENDEKNYIKEFVNQNSLNHSFINIHEEDHEKILEEINFYQDEPFSSVSFIHQFLLRKKINQNGYKVLMVGEGGDEVLAGYNRMFLPYLHSIYLKNKKKIPKEVKKNIKINFNNKFSFLEKELNLYSNILKKRNDIEDREIFNLMNIVEDKIPESLNFYNNTDPNKSNSFKSFLTNHIFIRDLPHILRQEDRISMSQSIENRSPFVDHKLIEYIFSIDEKYFMKNGLSKIHVKKNNEQKITQIIFE